MAGDEHQPQQVVADGVVDFCVEIRLVHFELLLDLACELAFLAAMQLGATQAIDGAMPGGGHEPGPGLIRDAGARPLFERRHHRILGQILGKAHVAHHASQARDEPGSLDAEDGLDGTLGWRRRHKEGSIPGG